MLNSLDDSTLSSTLNGLDSSTYPARRLAQHMMTQCSFRHGLKVDSNLYSNLDDRGSSMLSVALDGSKLDSALDGVGGSMLSSAPDGSTLSLVLVVLDSSTFGSTLDGSKLGLALNGSTLGSLLNDWTA